MKEGSQQEKQKKWDRESVRPVLSIAGLVVITACIIILFYFAVERFDGLKACINTLVGIMRPFIIGFVMAFLINPIMKFFEKRILPTAQRYSKTPESGAKFTRTICSILALLIFIGIIVLFMMVIIPDMWETVRFLIDNISDQIIGVLDWANEITKGHYADNISKIKESGVDKAIHDGLAFLEKQLNFDREEIISVVLTGTYSVGKLFVDIIIAIIVSVYILCSKEEFRGQVKKILYAVVPAKHANIILEIIRKANDIFYGFIVGKIIDSIIIGIICYVVMAILGMPYQLLVSVIIGLTNIIPVFGPYIGAVPTVIIIFLTDPMQGIYFLIFILILQQIDGNIIGPKILGNSTGLSAFWVVFAIVVGGGLFGFMGMIIGVPTMALVYYLIDRFIRYLLRKRNLPEGTEEYVELKSVDSKSNKLERNDPVTEEVARDGIFTKIFAKMFTKKK